MAHDSCSSGSSFVTGFAELLRLGRRRRLAEAAIRLPTLTSDLVAAGLYDGPRYPVRMCDAYFMTPRNLDEAEKSKLFGKSRMPRMTMRGRYILGAVI